MGIGTAAWRRRHRGGWPGLRFRDQFCVGGAEAPESPEAVDPHAPPAPARGGRWAWCADRHLPKCSGAQPSRRGRTVSGADAWPPRPPDLGVPHPAPVSVSVPGQQGVRGLLVKDLPAWGGPEIALLSPHLPAEEGCSLKDGTSHVLQVKPVDGRFFCFACAVFRLPPGPRPAGRDFWFILR